MRRPTRLLLLFVCFVPFSAYPVGMIISPVQLGLSGAPGSTASGVINVSSSQAQENTIRVSFADFIIDSAGRRTEVASSPRSCKSWLDVDQRQFVSPEEGRVPVVITAHIPPDASGSYWAQAFFESVPAPPALGAGPRRAPAVGVTITPRIGIPIIVTVSGSEKYDLKISGIEGEQSPLGIDATIRVENRGNAVAMVSGAVAVEKPSANLPEELASKDIDPVTSYPGVTRTIKVHVPPVAIAHDAKVHAYLRFGPRADQTMEASATLSRQANGQSVSN
ncbi:MAG TPA: hypothetical protein VL284_03755 [Thermoanaerobaculia bacterium]|nr:hypothetical protein [Thermoanaerobaculia bacterium]